MKSYQKLQIRIISEFSWCTLNLNDMLLKLIVTMPSQFTYQELKLKTEQTIETVYHLKNVRISRFRNCEGYDLHEQLNLSKLDQENQIIIYTSILEAEDNRQYNLTQFKANLPIHLPPVIDIPNQMNLPSLLTIDTASTPTDNTACSTPTRAHTPKVKPTPNKTPGGSRKSKLKNKMSFQVKTQSKVPNGRAQKKVPIMVKKVMKKSTPSKGNEESNDE